MALGHFSIAVVCLLFLVSCAKPPREAVKKEPENLDPKVALATLVEAWQSGDTTRLADLLDDGSVYVDIPNDATYKGVDGFKGYVDHVHAWASGTKMVVDLSVVGETSAVAGWTFSGVQDRPIGDRVPVATNKKFAIKGVTFLEVSGGKIKRATDYIDVAQLVLQLGGSIELPGGKVMKLGQQAGETGQ